MSTSTDRQSFRETVALVAEKARAKLPEQVNGRIESAVKLVLAHDVTRLEDGTIEVGSSSDPMKTYHLVGHTCTCTDFTQGKAPSGWCKHRISAGIDKRVRELLPVALPCEPFPDNDPPPVEELPLTPAVEPTTPTPAPLPEVAKGGGVCRAEHNEKHVKRCGRERYCLLTDTMKGLVDA